MKNIQIIVMLFVFTLQSYGQQTFNNPTDAIRAGLQEKANKGNVEAQKNLGLFELQNGNFAKAMIWLKKAADSGNADAQFNLALMYRDGEGCTVDYSQAMYWFKKSANNHSPRRGAYGEIGKMYQFGLGVSKDMSQAINWYKQGANLGDPYSMAYLGRIYRDSGDMDQALNWFRKAADAGDEECACYVYYLLEDKNLPTALYLKKSADAGYPNGMAWYGIRQIFGEGIQKNEKSGYDMIMNAASKGSEVAMEFLTKYKSNK